MFNLLEAILATILVLVICVGCYRLAVFLNKKL